MEDERKMNREDRELHVVCKMNIVSGYISTVYEGYGNKALVKAYSLMNGRTAPDRLGNYYQYYKVVE